MFYRIKDEKLLDYAEYEYAIDCIETNIITQAELDAHPNKCIVEGGFLVLNPNYEQEEAQKEAERVANLTCTKRVFALMLEQLGFSYYNQIQPLINANERARMEWELCVELQRKNPLLDIVAAEIGVTSEQLDKLFKFANDEITQQEFTGV